ncbi:LysR family transcriptional regulator [Paludibacterium paludis]|uniref:Transcriptional regulator n=1 Tax=Paludibacterium paludis TaxID=1225769 RepID=A0A918UAY6_9NEIS|nr:LysR family transcriptional regulator [Paludibacterium paludis]GGY19110.1 transcriptional regulator [Paludibacterium paludis]
MKLLWEIRAFCTVTDKKSFITAARTLGSSPSSITRAVQSLEEQLGTLLLNRTRSQISLTPAGELYYEHASRMLTLQDEAGDAIASLTSRPRGWLRLSAPESFAHVILPAALAKLEARHPELRFDIVYSDATLDPVAEKLDLAIRGAFPVSNDLIGYPLWPYRRYLFASPDYLARCGHPSKPEDLSNHAIIMHTAPRILRAWHFVSEQRAVSLSMHVRHRFNNGMAVVNAARQGLGVARLADWLVAEDEASGKLVRVCEAYRLVSSQGSDPVIHAVTPHRRLPARVRLLLDYLRAMAPSA